MNRIIYTARPSFSTRASVTLIIALGLSFLTHFAYAEGGLFTKPLDVLTGYQQRPLFSPSRRFQAVVIPNDVAPQPIAGQALNAVLLGVISASDGTGLAILRVEGQPETVRIHVGESINGWQLDAIDTHHTIFSSGEQKITLTFPESRTDAASTPTPNSEQVPAPLIPTNTPNP